VPSGVALWPVREKPHYGLRDVAIVSQCATQSPRAPGSPSLPACLPPTRFRTRCGISIILRNMRSTSYPPRTGGAIDNRCGPSLPPGVRVSNTPRPPALRPPLLCRLVPVLRITCVKDQAPQSVVDGFGHHWRYVLPCISYRPDLREG
jgi:hypothetical protein